jgi:hypothetical protein
MDSGLGDDRLKSSDGPGWAPHSLDVQGGRFPLSVEAHLLNMTASLVPGATTVTTSARYYTLHGAVALEAERRQLEVEDRLELLRRCEVLMAAASIVHPSATAGTVHGNDVLIRRSAGTRFDIDQLSIPKDGYSDARTGFLGPYIGSELTLGILDDGTMAPGKRLTGASLGNGFDGLFDLAGQPSVTADQLADAAGLSIGALRVSDDGHWLARQLCAVDLPDMDVADRTRAGTVRLLERAAALAPSSNIVESFRQVVACGPSARTDPVIAVIPEAEPWRGTLFRHDSVGAWRELWAWLVDAIDGPTRRSELIERLADELPGTTLGGFERELPATQDTQGDPIDAESLIRHQQRTVPSKSLALIMLGAIRASELTGPSRAALVGNAQKVAVLSPIWVGDWVDNRRHMHLRDVAGELTEVLLDRAMRIAMSKMRLRNGRMWLPSVVGERGEFLYRVGREGRGNVGLRLDQLAGLLRGVGVFDSSSAGWTLGPRGVELLGSTT